MAKKRRGAAVAAKPPGIIQRIFGFSGDTASTDKPAAPIPALPPRSVASHIREWTDAIVLATIVAMLVRTFVVEPFKIPSGSMTPELLGDLVAEGSATGQNGQPGQYLLVMTKRQLPTDTQVYRKDPATGYWKYEGIHPFQRLSVSQQQLAQRAGRIEEHRILVNRFAYWFAEPDRGDVAIFRVPFAMEPGEFTVSGVTMSVREFNRSQPVYVKRVVGLPGEDLSILGNQKRLAINGDILDSPAPFDHNDYFLPPSLGAWNYKLGPHEFALFGDNSQNSEDTRYWGPVPHSRLRGKAFLVYWPWKRMKFL
jgi:signal peptidase I